MRNLKRALSLALASVMLLGMMVVGTSASYPDVKATDNEEAIAVMQLLKIMEGDDKGNFNPAKAVTRNEMAVIMTKLLDLNTKDYAGSCPFTDVPAWAEPYVAACYANKIVSGTSATTYSGDATVTTAQAALMVLKALGYFQYAADFGDDWMVSTVKQASKISLFDGISSNANTALTRDAVAQMALNALEADVVDTDGNGGTTIKGDGFEISTGSTKYEKVENKKNDYKNRSAADDGVQQLVEKLFGTEVKKLTADQQDDFGRPATKWTYKNKDVDASVTAADEAEKVYVEGFDADELKDLDKAQKGDYDFSGAKVYVNGVKDDALDADDIADRDYNGTIVELYVDEDDTDKVTRIVVIQGYFAKVTDKDEDTIDLDVYNPWAGTSAEKFTYKNDTKKDDDKYDKLAGYEKDDYLMVYTKGAVADDDVDLLATSDVKAVSGKVATFKKDSGTGYNGYITMDGTKYILASGYNEVEIVAGDEYDFYLDENGYVIGAEKTKEADAKIDEIYYVDSIWTKSEKDAYDKPVVSYYAQIVALDGTAKIIDLESADKNDKDSTYAANKTNFEGKLVTLSDKKWTDETTDKDEHKAGDEKFDLKAWSNDDYDTKFVDGSTLKFGEFKKDTTRMTIGSTTYRFNDKTQYVMIGKTGADLKVTVKTGGVALAADKGGIVITEDGKTVALYVLIVDKSNKVDEGNTYSKDAIYVKSLSSEKGDGYRVQTVYYADGTKGTINVDEGEYASNLTSAGFYTYDTNDDGYYVVDTANAMTISNSFVWDDQEGTITGATIAKDALFENLLTVTADSKTISDIDVSKAAFVDVHDTDDNAQYDKTVSSLARLTDLFDNDKIGAVALSMNVSKDGAVIIIVTSIAAK